MNARRARAVCLALTLVIVGCKKGANPIFGEIPSGYPAIENSALLPANCAPATFDLDGAVWRVTGTAESRSGACAWPVGQTRVLCEMEWTLVATQFEGVYEVHWPYDGSDSFFRARLCGEELYLDGTLAMRLESTGCALGTPVTYGVFIGEATPPVAWLSFAEGMPASGVAEVGDGVVDVHLATSSCELELVLELTRVGVAPVVHGTEGTGGVVLVGDAQLARELARADLGLLLRGAERRWTWLPMGLFVDGGRLEVELAAGSWSVAIAPRPGSGEDAGEPLVVVEVHAGERTSLGVGFTDRAARLD